MTLEELRLLDMKMEEDINSAINSHKNFVTKVRKDYEEVRNKFIDENRKFPNGFKFVGLDNGEWAIQCVARFSLNNGFEYTAQSVDKNWEGYYEQTYFIESEIEELVSHQAYKVNENKIPSIKDLLPIWDECVVDLIRSDYRIENIRLRRCELCYDQLAGDYYIRCKGVTFSLNEIKNIRKCQ